MMYKLYYVGLLPLLAAAFAGCGTTPVALKYQAPAGVAGAAQSKAAVAVGKFADQRGEPTNWLGTIRGGFGNPLKTMESSKPVSEAVADVFADGLRARGWYADEPNAAYVLGGVIKKLDSDQYIRREANAAIEVTLIERAGGKQLLSKAHKAQNIEGSPVSLSTGVFGSIEELRVVMEKTLRQVVDEALDDPAFRAALR